MLTFEDEMVILFLVLSGTWTLVTTWKFTLKLLRFLELLIMYIKTFGITQNPHSGIPSNCADWLQLWVNRLISSKSAKIQQQLPANSCIHLCIQQVFHKWVLVHYFFALKNLRVAPKQHLKEKLEYNEVTQWLRSYCEVWPKSSVISDKPLPFFSLA